MIKNEELVSLETQQWLDTYYYNSIGYTWCFFEYGEVSFINESVRPLMELSLRDNQHPYSNISIYLENPKYIDEQFESLLEDFRFTNQEIVRVDSNNFTYVYKNKNTNPSDKYYDMLVEGYYTTEIIVDYITEFNTKIENYLKEANDLLLSEFARCNNPSKYLNKVAEYIMDEYSTCKKKLYIHSESNTKYRPFHRILLNQYRKIMEHILDNYPAELKTSIYNELIYRTRKKEAVKSFKIKGNSNRLYKSRYFENDFNMFKKKNLIANNTSFQTFCELFEGKVLIDKICWSGTISSLYTFIQMLVGKDKATSKIEPTLNKHWEIAASCFTLNNINLDRSDFPNLHHIKDIRTITFFRNFIRQL